MLGFNLAGMDFIQALVEQQTAVCRITCCVVEYKLCIPYTNVVLICAQVEVYGALSKSGPKRKKKRKMTG